MATPTKGFSLLLVTTLAVFVTAEKKVQIGKSESITVSQSASIALPIEFTAVDYTGPYDPADPKGIGAANRRQMHINGKKNADLIKSYIPPGLENVAKKEAIKLVKNEGKRFALSHPKETADLVGIVAKAKGLVSSASHKIKQEEKLKEKSKNKN